MMRVIQTNLPTFGASVGPFVVLGKYTKLLEPFERDAIVAHEMGHIKLRHSLKHFKMLFRPWDSWIEAARQSEFEADAYAVRAGHALGLIHFHSRFKGSSHKMPENPTLLERIRHAKTLLHPAPNERISHIMSLLAEEILHG